MVTVAVPSLFAVTLDDVLVLTGLSCAKVSGAKASSAAAVVLRIGVFMVLILRSFGQKISSATGTTSRRFVSIRMVGPARLDAIVSCSSHSISITR
jgi:hypothetical protein